MMTLNNTGTEKCLKVGKQDHRVNLEILRNMSQEESLFKGGGPNNFNRKKKKGKERDPEEYKGNRGIPKKFRGMA